jgi:hypothetical protein
VTTDDTIEVSCLNFETLTELWRYPGVNLMPSAKSIRGQDSRNDSTVITEKRFMSSITSCVTRQFSLLFTGRAVLL